MTNKAASANLGYFLPWLFYFGTALFLFVGQTYYDFLLTEEKDSVAALCSFCLLGGAILASLTQTLSFKIAVGYVLYWLGIGFLIEYSYISTHLLEHHGRSAFIFDVVPLTLPFYWLILFFSIHALGTFFSFFIKKESSSNYLVKMLTIDGLLILAFSFLFEPLGQQIGLWTWNRSSDWALIWTIPLIVFIEYFVGIYLVMLPIRWLEIHKQPPKEPSYRGWIKFPCYFGWSLFVVNALGTSYFSIEGSNYLAIFLVISLTFLIFRLTVLQQKRRYSEE